MADNKSLTHRWFEEVWNQGRETTIDELLGTNIVAFGLGEGGTEVHGHEGLSSSSITYEMLFRTYTSRSKILLQSAMKLPCES